MLALAEALRSALPQDRLYSSVAERQSCKLKVLGSIPSEGFPAQQKDVVLEFAFKFALRRELPSL